LRSNRQSQARIAGRNGAIAAIKNPDIPEIFAPPDAGSGAMAADFRVRLTKCHSTS
jgi:hypothetical protein